MLCVAGVAGDPNRRSSKFDDDSCRAFFAPRKILSVPRYSSTVCTLYGKRILCVVMAAEGLTDRRGCA